MIDGQDSQDRVDGHDGAGREHAHGRVVAAAALLGRLLSARRWCMATAESCTGGLVAGACTAIPGSSAWFERGVVTYSNAAKTDLLGVPAALIGTHGAVSEEVARAMAEGLLATAPVQLALSVTGIAGPGGAVPGKPVGTVWLAVAATGRPTTALRLQLDGDRDAVRRGTVDAALRLLQRAASAP